MDNEKESPFEVDLQGKEVFNRKVSQKDIYQLVLFIMDIVDDYGIDRVADALYNTYPENYANQVATILLA